MTQWIKPVPGKLEDRSSDYQSPCECWADGVATCHSEAEAADPWGETGQLDEMVSELWVQLETLLQYMRWKMTEKDVRHQLLHVCTKVNTHQHTNMLTHMQIHTPTCMQHPPFKKEMSAFEMWYLLSKKPWIFRISREVRLSVLSFCNLAQFPWTTLNVLWPQINLNSFSRLLPWVLHMLASLIFPHVSKELCFYSTGHAEKWMFFSQ